MKEKDILRERDVGKNKKSEKIKSGNNTKDKLSERELEELMSHSSYKRHKGAIKQVK